MCKRCIIGTILLLIAAAIFIFYLTNKANGATGEVLINEIAWMGTESSTSDEWVELYNTTNSPIDLNGWTLIAQDGTPNITLEKTIPAGGFFLLERPADSTVPNIPADLIYKGALGNSGEYLILKNTSGETIDGVNAQDGWTAGNNSTKATMERTSSGWQTGPVGGTPKTYNSQLETHNFEEETPEPESQLKPKPEPETYKQPDSETNQQNTNEIDGSNFVKTEAIIISEFLPNPAGNDAEAEWIEIYNNKNEAQDISGWFLDNIEGGSKSFKFPENTKISAKSYAIFSIQTTRIVLTNKQDSVRLLYPDGSFAYSIEYEDASEGLSYALINNSWQWTETPTPGSSNIYTSTKTKNKSVTSGADNKISKKPENANLPVNEEKENQENKVKALNSKEFSAQIAQNENLVKQFRPFLIIAAISLLGMGSFMFIKTHRKNQNKSNLL